MDYIVYIEPNETLFIGSSLTITLKVMENVLLKRIFDNLNNVCIIQNYKKQEQNIGEEKATSRKNFKTQYFYLFLLA